MPLAWWRWKVARETGWTLEYIDGLSYGDWCDLWTILEAEGKAVQDRSAAAQARAAQTRKRRR